MKNRSKSLNEAKKSKDDEYHTDYKDATAEMELFMEELKGEEMHCPGASVPLI